MTNFEGTSNQDRLVEWVGQDSVVPERAGGEYIAELDAAANAASIEIADLAIPTAEAVAALSRHYAETPTEGVSRALSWAAQFGFPHEGEAGGFAPITAREGDVIGGYVVHAIQGDPVFVGPNSVRRCTVGLVGTDPIPAPGRVYTEAEHDAHIENLLDHLCKIGEELPLAADPRAAFVVAVEDYRDHLRKTQYGRE